MRLLLDTIFRSVIHRGTLQVRWPDGRLSTYGSGNPRAGVRVRSWSAARRIALHPALAFPEAYMDGTLVPEGGDIFTVLDVVQGNMAHTPPHPVMQAGEAARRVLKRLRQFNPAARAARNVAHHYDLDDRLYGLFLDADRQYSCAYFETGTETLEAAQLAKKRHIAAKLLLDRPGLTVLDIGCGWGGMTITLARDYGAVVTGITLSREQLDWARARAERAGLAGRVRFELRDYRQTDGQYDRIVSVGMFEHVGIDHYGAYFRALRRLLAPDGVALVHTIGRLDGPGETGPFIRKYIFPGGYVPALSEIMPHVERSGLLLTDVEVLRLHYARTISHWRARFAAHRDEAAALYDERFCRMWEFYLAASENAFRHQNQANFQLQLACGQEAVPLTRGYMERGERQAALVQGDEG